VAPVLIKVAVAAALAIALLRAFVGPPPASLHPVLALFAGFAGAVGYPIAVLVAAGREAALASILLAGSVTALALAVWAARGPSDDGGEPVEDGPDPPVDWEAFDRMRDAWERVRPS
jgi:hypothetical protein